MNDNNRYFNWPLLLAVAGCALFHATMIYMAILFLGD